jgi:DNA-binding LacI/PurR family transcriptional regulator
MRPTIRDIAERAGVSKTTVSFALNDPSRISVETYNRVMAVVNELDYIPNPVARTLTTKRLGALGLLLPQPITETLRNPYVVEIIRGIGELCAERELSLTMLPPVRGRIIEAARRAFVDGLITIGIGPGHEVVELLNKRHIPFVTIDGADTEYTVNVGVDDESAAYSLMRHVLGLGHRRIVVLALMPESIKLSEERFYSVCDRRLAGFSRAMAEVGLRTDSPGISVLPTESSIEGGDAAISKILRRPPDGAAAEDGPTAIVAMCDAVALGAYQACRRLSLSIPSDISVAGFDDIPMAANAMPPLTTVYQPGREKGSVAADLVALLLDGGDAGHRCLDTRLAIRSSTAAPRKAAPSSATPSSATPLPGSG